MKINNYRGDLTDISAKKEALGMTSEHSIGYHTLTHGAVAYDIRCLILKQHCKHYDSAHTVA